MSAVIRVSSLNGGKENAFAEYTVTNVSTPAVHRSTTTADSHLACSLNLSWLYLSFLISSPFTAFFYAGV